MMRNTSFYDGAICYIYAFGIVNTAVSVGTATLLDILHNAFLCTGQPTAINRRTLTFQLYIRIYSQHNNIILLNCHFTFHQRPTLKKVSQISDKLYTEFHISIPNGIHFTALNLNSTLAYICAAILGTPLTFAAMKLMVFRRRKSTT